METTLQSPTSNEKKSLTSGKNTSHRGNDAQCPTFPSRQTVVQAKLELTTPGDSYEQEADRMADHVMRSAFSVSDGDGQSPRQTMSRPIVSRRSSGSGGVAVDSQTESGIMSSRGGGSSLPTALRSRMETGFGADFSNVRIHNDATAASLSNSIQAKAFTYGNDIYFNRGQYSPSSPDGQRLIAHELTHTLQQTGKVGRRDYNQELSFQEYQNINQNIRLNENRERFYNSNFSTIVDFATNDSEFKPYVDFAKAIKRNNPDISIPNEFKGKHLRLFYKEYVKSPDNFTNDIYVKFINYVEIVTAGVEDIYYTDKDGKSKFYVDEKVRERSYSHLSNEKRKDGKGITIVIMTDQDSDKKAVYSNQKYAKNKFFFIDDHLYENDYFFILQGLDTLKSYEDKIELLVRIYGPLQNLVISGHGNWDRIRLGSDLLLVTTDEKTRLYYDFPTSEFDFSFSDNFEEEYNNTLHFFRKIDELMNQSRNDIKNSGKGELKQSIYLDACLTNSKKYVSEAILPKNFYETMRQYIGGDVKIWANSASSNNDQEVYYDKHGSLIVKDEPDPTIQKNHKEYSGNDFFNSRTMQLGNIWQEITIPNKSEDGNGLRSIDNLSYIFKWKYFVNNTLDDFIQIIQRENFKFHSDRKNALIEACNKTKTLIETWLQLHEKDQLAKTKTIGALLEVSNNPIVFKIFIREVFYEMNFLSNKINDSEYKNVFYFANENTRRILNEPFTKSNVFLFDA